MKLPENKAQNTGKRHLYYSKKCIRMRISYEKGGLRKWHMLLVMIASVVELAQVDVRLAPSPKAILIMKSMQILASVVGLAQELAHLVLFQRINSLTTNFASCLSMEFTHLRGSFFLISEELSSAIGSVRPHCRVTWNTYADRGNYGYQSK